MIYKYKIPRYIKGKFFTEDFNSLFISQFFKNDPIEIDLEEIRAEKTQDYKHENYVKNLYREIIKKFEVDNNYDNLIKHYRLFKESYSVHFRWDIYESFCDYLININRPEEAFKEWVLLQEEEWDGFDRDFTYRDSAIQRIIYFEGLLKKSLICGYHLQKIAPKGNQLTSFGKRNKSEVFLTLDLMINNSSDSSYFEQFYSNYEFKNHLKFKSFPFEYYKKYFQHSKEAKNQWDWVIDSKSGLILKNGKASARLVFVSIKQEASRLLRHGENTYRLNIGAKKIGESWIAETELFYKIKNALPEIEVIQHGRPSWLGRQHFDIWIPELKIAIEYQGKQHDEPIEFFGGLEAFEKGIKRDKVKKKKCLENKVKLIEVREGYILTKIIEEVNGTKDVE
ncbi:hypothetical protein N9P25_02540 [Flavobacteriaceae bacterium]|nr:hypothetical protein [Flavobacteriaceae bacterium]